MALDATGDVSGAALCLTSSEEMSLRLKKSSTKFLSQGLDPYLCATGRVSDTTISTRLVIQKTSFKASDPCL